MKIYKKLQKVQKEIGAIVKESKNPFYKSKYAALPDVLDAVQPVLEKNGLILLQNIENQFVTSKIVDVESGEAVQSAVKIPEAITDPQKIGGAITYFRRYTLTSLLALKEQDDDANHASGVLNEL